MATSSGESCGCKHQAKNGHAKGEQTQSHLPSSSVRVAGRWIHVMTNKFIFTLDNLLRLSQRTNGCLSLKILLSDIDISDMHRPGKERWAPDCTGCCVLQQSQEAIRSAFVGMDICSIRTSSSARARSYWYLCSSASR